jgi:hypothetical protein
VCCPNHPSQDLHLVYRLRRLPAPLDVHAAALHDAVDLNIDGLHGADLQVSGPSGPSEKLSLTLPPCLHVHSPSALEVSTLHPTSHEKKAGVMRAFSFAPHRVAGKTRRNHAGTYGVRWYPGHLVTRNHIRTTA